MFFVQVLCCVVSRGVVWYERKKDICVPYSLSYTVLAVLCWYSKCRIVIVLCSFLYVGIWCLLFSVLHFDLYCVLWCVVLLELRLVEHAKCCDFNSTHVCWAHCGLQNGSACFFEQLRSTVIQFHVYWRLMRCCAYKLVRRAWIGIKSSLT